LGAKERAAAASGIGADAFSGGPKEFLRAREASKILGVGPEKAEGAKVQDAGITPEAVPRKGGEKEIRECI
jgi:hypothetical protein